MKKKFKYSNKKNKLFNKKMIKNNKKIKLNKLLKKKKFSQYNYILNI